VNYLTETVIHVDRYRSKEKHLCNGAVVEFLGVVRGEEKGRAISFLEYEAYAPMAEKIIHTLIEETKKKWPVRHIHILHRIGRVPAGETSLLIHVEAPHRGEAFEACRFLLEEVKREVPIWKKENVREASCRH